MAVSKLKIYDNRIYLKDDLQKILDKEELQYINGTNAVLFFPDEVSLQRVKESLKVINTILEALIKDEEHESNTKQ